MSTPPSATPAVPQKSGIGCLLAVILFPIVVLAGIVIGTVLNRPEADTGEKAVTIDEGTIGSTAWRVDAVRDVDDDTCAFLYQDGEQLTGGCEVGPDDATFGDQTVVFGKADTGASTVSVRLSDGQVVDIPTVTADGIAGRYFSAVVDGDVDAAGFADG